MSRGGFEHNRPRVRVRLDSTFGQGTHQAPRSLEGPTKGTETKGGFLFEITVLIRNRIFLNLSFSDLKKTAHLSIITVYEFQDQSLRDPSSYTEQIKDSLLKFDHLFANFEYQ